MAHFLDYYQMKIVGLSKILVLLVLSIAAFSCKTATTCPEIKANGNIGTPVNTTEDELSPFIFDKEFIYTNRNLSASEFSIQSGIINKQNVSNTLPFRDNEISKIKNSGLLKIYRKNELNRTFAYFAGINTNSKIQNSDIFFTFKNDKDNWVRPLSLPEINTAHFESYPAISYDGNLLVFSSDRPDGIGGIDLYVSMKDENGKWSTPINLGDKINTEGDEISPYIGYDGSLMFSSNGKSDDKVFNIYIANEIEPGVWTNPHKLPAPINTKYNETGASIFDNYIYLSSDRPGGCGGYDIYSFTHCGEVFVEGTVEGEQKELPLDGKLYLFDGNRELINVTDVKNDGVFKINLKPSNIYYLQYFNSCVPNYVPEQMLIAPCSDTTVVKILVKFIIPVSTRKFDFANYKVPFFVSGYYHPNTPKSLENLRLKFAYNLLGNDLGSKYIEKPGPNYDDYSLVVQSALDDAVEHIGRILSSTSDDCIKNSNNFKIKVSGFADPRPISEHSEYADESIKDVQLNFSIEKGEKIDNIKLSKLRAYFTAKYILTKIKSEVEPSQFNLIKWEIEGLGIDESEQTDELKRRVNIEIGVENL